MRADGQARQADGQTCLSQYFAPLPGPDEVKATLPSEILLSENSDNLKHVLWLVINHKVVQLHVYRPVFRGTYQVGVWYVNMVVT